KKKKNKKKKKKTLWAPPPPKGVFGYLMFAFTEQWKNEPII
ncbi:hypothetical protein HMPREF9503_01798, partial [Enterococcus faecalis TX0043]